MARAVEEFETVLEAWDNRPDVLLDYAAALDASHAESQRIIEVLEKARALGPHLMKVHEMLGMAYFRTGRIGESLVELRAVLSIEPENVTAQFNLASLLRVLGRRDEAISEYYKVIEVAPHFERARSELLHLIGDMPAQEVAVLKLTDQRLNPAPPTAVPSPVADLKYDLVQPIQTGVVFLEGEEILTELQKMGHLESRVRELLASEQLDQQAATELIDSLGAWVPVGPASTGMQHELLGALHLRLGNVKEALRHFRTAVGAIPHAFFAHNNLAIAYWQVGQLGRALEEWDLTIALGPKDCGLMLQTAFLCAELKLMPQAIARFERFVRECPDHDAAPGIKELAAKLKALEPPSVDAQGAG